MAQVFVSIGSNIEREKHILAALDALADQFGELGLSPVYESEAVGFEGDPFLNLVAGFHTTLPVAALSQALRAIENRNGRVRTAPRFSGRTLDIDILTYDAACGDIDGILLPRAEILHNAFVLLPLSDLAPDSVHPALQQTYRTLWSGFASDQKLWPVDFSWRGTPISHARAASATAGAR